MSTVQLLRRITGFVLIAIFFSIFTVSRQTQAEVKSPHTVYTNSKSITINTASSAPPVSTAALYPSAIDVSGMTGNITRVAVTLDGFTHIRPSDADLLLVSPTGAKYVFLSDISSSFDLAEDRLFTFADDAAGTLPAAGSPSGAYRPTADASPDIFPAPAPAGPYNAPPSSTFASVFNGTSPNGTWSLYVVDDAQNNPGSINAGWSLTITTDGGPQTFANRNYIALNDLMTPSNPYGTAINISGVTGAISNLKVTLNGFTHTRPTDVDVLLVSPNGRAVNIMSDAGFAAASNANLTFDDAAAATLSTPVVTGSYKPTDNDFEVADTFPAPAPLRPYYTVSGSNQLSNFYGFSPNGEWRLYVVDDELSQAGSIAGGWSLDITTTPLVPPPPPSCVVPTFSPTSIAAGTNPTNIAVADFNGDNKSDLAVTNQVSNDVSILLGNGDGTFQPQTLLSAGSGPYAIVAGKFNADNNFDLAVANSGSNNVSIYLGNGNGTFSAPTNFFVGSSPLSIAAGDLNNDSKQDLAIANFGSFFSGSVSVLLGNGTGGFSAGTSVRTRTQPAYVTIANINGDPNQDLLIANFGSNSISTFIGSGNGLFQLNQNLTVGQGPVAIEVADLSGDGVSDLSIANYNSDTISFCTGNVNGSFSCLNSSPAGGANPISMASADFLGSGSKALATALSGSNLVKVLTNSVSVGQSPNAIKSADFNGDEKPDLVTANAGSNDISVLLNSCAVAKGNLFDWNGDRRTDYVVLRPSNNAWYNPTLNPSSVARFFARPGDKIVPADYDGDHLTDYAFYRPETGLWVVQTPNGRPINFTQFGVAIDIPVPADYDGDAKADVAVWRPSDGNWYIRRSTDNSVQVLTFGVNGDKPAPADYDGDGKDDLAVFRPSTGYWYILRSSDWQASIVGFGVSEDKTVPADYDGDGKADIAVWRPSTGVWYVLKSSDGNFRAVGWGATGDIPVVGDFESDGKFDFAIWRPSDRYWYVLKSSDGAPLYFQWGASTDYPVPNVFIR